MVRIDEDERALGVLSRVTGLTSSLLRPDSGGIEASLRASTVLRAMKAFASMLLHADEKAPTRIWIEQPDDAEPVEYIRADLVADIALRGRALGIVESMEIAAPPLVQRKGPPGIWRRRRAQIADDIRALIPSGPAPQEILMHLPEHIDDWSV